MDEFRFFNNFKTHNPDCEFVFIAVSDFTKKSILKNKSELNFPVSIITVKETEDLHKLDGLSGVFSYMTRNTFFGGAVDRSCSINYMISSYCTNDLKIPLFIRTPDSEYPYMDYKKLADNRVNGNGDSAKKFAEGNRAMLDLMPKYIDYDQVYFIANGSPVICDWVVDVAHNDLKPDMQMMNPEAISERTLYVSDADLFNVHSHYQKYNHLPKDATVDKLIFIGYLQGSVAKGRTKVLPKLFKNKTKEIPMNIIGPGASELKIDREDIELHDKGIYGDEFFETMNSHLAYIFIGKGNSVNKYINKTIYDCISARCPILVYSECDTTGIIFDDKDFYFSNEDELYEKIQLLRNPDTRRLWIDAQYTMITNKLNTLFLPMFKFSDYCQPKEIKSQGELKMKPLF